MEKIKKLILKGVSCDTVDIKELANYDNKEICRHIVLEISSVDENGIPNNGSNLFYFTLTTPEFLALNATISTEYFLVKNRIFVIGYLDYKKLVFSLNNIISKCCKNTWEDSVIELLKYFEWEYEDY